MSVEDARNKRLVAALVLIAPNQKKGVFSEVTFALPNGVTAVQLLDVELSLTKISNTSAIASAVWKSNGGCGNYCSPCPGYPTELVAEFVENNAPLGSVNFGPWMITCHQVLEFANGGISVPLYYFDLANQVAIPSLAVRAASC